MERKELKRVKKMTRKGFTLIELMVVAVLALLFAGAAAYYATKDRGGQLALMKRDADLAKVMEARYMNINGVAFADSLDNSNSNEAARKQIEGDIYLLASPYDKVETQLEDCDGDGTAGDGFSVTVTSPKAPNKEAVFNSCTDAGVKIVDTGNNG